MTAKPKCKNCSQRISPGESYEISKDEGGQIIGARHTTPLYFDECVIGAKKALQQMGFCVVPMRPRGTPDVEWLAEAGANGWTVITQDRRIAENPSEMKVVVLNKVKCFILPAQRANPWDTVRVFASLWDKIETESQYPGPFVWRFNGKGQLPQWEQLYPKEKVLKALDLSRVPLSHLLNLFADVVGQHDDGWFSLDSVNVLHENITREIEARIARNRSLSMEKDIGWESVADVDIDVSPGENGNIPLAEPIDLSEYQHCVLHWTPDREAGRDENYPWIIPARRFLLSGSRQHLGDGFEHVWGSGFYRGRFSR